MEIQEKREKIIKFEQELKDLKKKHRVDPIPTIEFPQFRQLPEEVLLALKVIEKYEYKIMLTYVVREKE